MPEWIVCIIVVFMYVLGFMDGRGSALPDHPFWNGYWKARTLAFLFRH